MTDSPTTPTFEVLPPENPPDYDLFVFLTMGELLVIKALVDLLESGEV
jgi:hypothetical protein